MNKMPNIDEIKKDPDFYGLPIAEKHKVLMAIDSDYAGLPVNEQTKVLKNISYTSMKDVVKSEMQKFDKGTEAIKENVIEPATQGFPRGAYNVVGAPVDIANTALSIIGLGVDKPFLGSKMIKEVAGVPEPDYSKGLISNIAGGIGEQFGAGITGLGGAAGISSKAFQYLSKIPFKQLLKIESATLIGSGTGSGISRTLMPDSNALDIASQLIGGLGVAGTLKLIQFVKSISPKKVSQQVADEFAATKKEPYLSNLKKAGKIQEETGAQFTTGEASGSPTLIAKERANLSAGDDAFKDTILTQKASTNAALNKYARDIIPESSLDDLVDSVATNRASSLKDVDTLTEKFYGIDKQEIGTELFSKLKAAATRKYLEMKNLYDDISKVNPPLDASGLLDTTAKFRNRFGSEQIINMVEKTQKNGVLSFNNARQLRTQLGKMYADEMKKTSPQNADILGELYQASKKTLDQVGSMGGELGQKYTTATQRYLDEYVKVFKQSSNRNILRMGAGGETSRVPMSEIGKEYFSAGKGAREKAQQFKAALGNDSSAVADLTEYVGRDFYDNAINHNTGQVDGKKLNQWLKGHGEFFLEFPDMRKPFLNIKSAQSKADEIVKSTLMVLSKNGEPVALNKIMSSILSSKNPEFQITKLIKASGNEKAALEGVRSAIWNEALKKAEMKATDSLGQPLLNDVVLSDFMSKNKNVFSKLYSPEEIRKMKVVQEGYSYVSRGKKPLTTGSDTAEKAGTILAQFGGSPQLLSRPYAIGRWITSNVLKVIGNYKTAEKTRLLQQALINPDVADIFLRMDVTKPEITIRRLNAYLINPAAEISQESTPGNQEE